MSLVEANYGSWVQSFPRVSGDEPLSVASLAASASFSPRERG